MQRNKEFYIRLGWSLRLERRRRKINSQELARKLDVTSQQLSKYESGENRIPIDKFDAYCRELGVNPKWLIDWSRRVTIIE